MTVTITAAELAMIREGIGLSREHLAVRLGVSVRTIGHWEAGKYPVPAGVATEVKVIEREWTEEVEAAVARHADATGRTMLLPRTGTPEKPAAWHRSIAFHVCLRLPGTIVDYV